MYREEGIKGYEINEWSVKVDYWKELLITKTKSYEGVEYVGIIYEIKNITNDSIVFHESEFYYFGEDVLAVAIQDLKVLPNSKTRVFVVERGGHGK